MLDSEDGEQKSFDIEDIDFTEVKVEAFDQESPSYTREEAMFHISALESILVNEGSQIGANFKMKV